MNELVISIKNAYKKFGEQVVLNDVSLEIYKGRIYGIIGRNGSGKQSYLKHMWIHIIRFGRNNSFR